MKSIAIASLAAASVIISAACGGSDDGQDAASSTPTPFPNQADDPNAVGIRGAIVTISAPVEGESLGAVVVEGPVEADTKYARAAVRITEVTQYFRRQGTETVPAVFGDLAVGTRVEVKFEGNVTTASTAIGIGREIIIIE